MKKYFLLILSVIIMISLNSCKKYIQPVTKSDFFLGRVVTITLYDGSGEELIDQAFNEITRIENLLSKNIESSDVSNINKNAGISSVKVSPETLENIEKGIYFRDISNGLFDITIGPLVKLWDIGGKGYTVPDEDKIHEALSYIDTSKLIVSSDTVFLEEKGMELDLGGIAKGYIADHISGYLKDMGCKSAIINLGGNILTVGKKPSGDKWKIGIQDPFSRKGDYLAVLHVEERSVVTSGIYERYFIEDDVLYHHILDPFTGYPVISDIAGVTIISRKSIDGDGLSTSVFSMGIEEGLKLIDSIEDTEAVFVTTDKEMFYTSGIGKDIFIEFTD